MNKTFQYRLYPTKIQQAKLNGWLALCCETYNAGLQERRDAYHLAATSIGFPHQSAELPACKEERPERAPVNSQVLHDVLTRVNWAFNGKWAIHPAQIEIINQAFTPTAEEIAKAKHIVDEYEKADVQGGLGAIVIDDQVKHPRIECGGL